MAFTAEVKAKLGLDTTEFQRGLTKATADLKSVSDDTNRKLRRSFGGDDAIKGLLQGAGIGSIESIVSKLTEGFREASESAKRILEHTAETLGIYEKIFSSRRNDQQNLDANLAKQARLQRELTGTVGQSEMRTMYGPGGAYQARVTTRAGNPERAAEIAKELAQLAADELSIKDKIAKKEDESAAKREAQTVATESARLKALDMERANSDKQRTDEENLALLQSERASKAAMASETDYERKQDIAELDGKILDLEKKIAEQKEKQAESHRDIADQLVKAEAAARKASSDGDDAFADRSSLSLEDAARSGSGSVRAKAKRIQMLEARARRRRGSGFEAEAFEDTSRALKLRESMGVISSSERNPMASAEEAIKKSEEHLREISSKLSPETTK
jgi:hypothetical protein